MRTFINGTPPTDAHARLATGAASAILQLGLRTLLLTPSAAFGHQKLFVALFLSPSVLSAWMKGGLESRPPLFPATRLE